MARSAFRLVWRSSPVLFIAVIALQALSALAVAAQLLIGRDLLVTVLRVQQPQERVAAVALPLGVILALSAGLAGSRASRSELMRLLSEQVGRYAQGGVVDVATSVDLASFEDPAFHDRLRRAHVASFRPLMLTTDLLTVVGNAFAIATLLVVLGVLHPVLAPVLLATCVPPVMMQTRNGRLTYDLNVKLTPEDRFRLYLLGVLCDKDAAKEIRAFQAAGFFRGRYDALFAKRLAALRTVTRARLRRAVASALVGSVLMAASFALLLGLVMVGRLSFAAAMAAAIAIQQLSLRLQGVAAAGTSFLENGLVLGDLDSFVGAAARRTPAVAKAPASSRGSEPREVRTDNLDFRYPGCNRLVLADVSVSVRRGEVVAIVGRNGSGKTTLAKVLANLYQPDRGQVFWDGADVTDLDPEEVRRQVSVIFQDFGRYCLSVEDNIALGYEEASEDEDAGAIRSAARSAEAEGFILNLPQGYQTVLGRQFDGGHEVSLGQWQRVALARAMLRPGRLLILDEPSSVLDVEAEYRLFESISSLGHDRATVLISHRFATVRSADRIYVLDEGRVAESGSHAELLSLGGLYATMYCLQSASPSVGRSEKASWLRGHSDLGGNFSGQKSLDSIDVEVAGS